MDDDEYLKDLEKSQMWRLDSDEKFRGDNGYILCDRYTFMEDSLEARLRERNPEMYEGEEKEPVTEIEKKYYYDLEKFGDKIIHLTLFYSNFHPMSAEFRPHVLYLTPQCGEHKRHQEILEKFTEINKSYCGQYD